MLRSHIPLYNREHSHTSIEYPSPLNMRRGCLTPDVYELEGTSRASHRWADQARSSTQGVLRTMTSDANQPMTCPECGREGVEGTRYCFCGHDLEAATVPPPDGVGGWLLFFCVQLVIFAPGFFLMNALNTVAAITKLGATTPIGVLLSVDVAVRLQVVGAGAYIGSMLWRGQRAGVRLVRPYLIILPAVYLLLACLPFAFAFANDIQVALARPHLIGAMSSIPGCVVWWFYFGESRRVRATYGLDLAAKRE